MSLLLDFEYIVALLVDTRRRHIFLPFLLTESQFCVMTTGPDPEDEARQFMAHC